MTDVEANNNTTNNNNNTTTTTTTTNTINNPDTTTNADADASLLPPPRPSSNVGSTADYFAGAQIPSHHLSFEPNPFEHSFGAGSVDTPGGTKLPPVAALTSPASLLPGGASTPYPWGGGSLRTGPLSPAMLSGPTGDYFGDTHHLRGGFTPNESSLRTGLTPGGGGSMFPAPSPNSQALFNQLASGGATPSTIDFHRTALSAAAARKRNEQAQQSITSQPQDMSNGGDVKQVQNTTNEAFAQHDANDAANGLFMLASQSRNSSQGVNQYTMAPQQPVHPHAHPAPQQQQQDARQNGSVSAASGRGVSEASARSDESEQARPNTRGKGKKASSTNGRRKAEDAPAKAPASKKSKSNNGNAHYMEPEPPSEDEQDMKQDEYNANGKKMTDEEKRKNFLERNRFVPPSFRSYLSMCIANPHSVAALKCRQRKKQWLANLQSKVEMFSSENDQLSSQISALREEVVALKTMLLAHKDCPVTQSQTMSGNYMGQAMQDYGGQMQNPYGMAMPGQQQVMAGQGGMNRRFS